MTKISDIKLGQNFSRPFGVGNFSELAESMQQHGQITPVIIDKDNNLIAGFRRLAAALSLEWEDIDTIECKGDPKIINLIENMNREGLSLWDECRSILDVFGPEPVLSEISRVLSKSRTWVKPRVEIWTLPQGFQDKVLRGESGVAEIRKMLKEKTPKDQIVTTRLTMPTTGDVKELVSWLMDAGRECEAVALSYACGSVNREAVESGPSWD